MHGIDLTFCNKVAYVVPRRKNERSSHLQLSFLSFNATRDARTHFFSCTIKHVHKYNYNQYIQDIYICFFFNFVRDKKLYFELLNTLIV